MLSMAMNAVHVIEEMAPISYSHISHPYLRRVVIVPAPH